MDAKLHVRWKTFEDLRVSLLEFEQLYADCPDRRRELRDLVIQAKDRARFAAQSQKVAPDKRAQKDEMVRWMLVWLDDPSMFDAWVELRRTQLNRP